MSFNDTPNGFDRNGHPDSPTGSHPKRDVQPERVREAPIVPSYLYEVDDAGLYKVSDELDAIRVSEVEASLLPLEQIENVAGKPDATDQVTNLAESIVDEPRAGLLAAIDHDETYLDHKATQLNEERGRLQSECLNVPYDTKERDPSAGWKNMQWLEVGGLVTAVVFCVVMAAWTAASDLTLVFDNLQYAFPVESDDIDFAAMYSGDDIGAVSEEPTGTPIYSNPNAYKSVAIFSTLFVFFAWLDVMKLAPLSSYRAMPPGIFAKVRWLFTPLGLVFSVQVVLLLAAVSFNFRIGFELDRSAVDIDVEPPISSATTYSLLAVALAFSAYAFLHWVAQIFDRLCGVRWLPNPMRVAMNNRLSIIDRQLESVVSILTCFKGIRGEHEAAKNRFVAECLSVLAGIQDKQRRAAELAEAAAQQAAATARMKSLGPSVN
jgi:hypothetical protein